MFISHGGLRQSPYFFKLWVGQTISLFGSHIGSAALRYTALLFLSAGSQEMALLAVAALLPGLILALPAGIWVDRVRRKPLLIAADLGRAFVLLWIPLAWMLGWLRMEQLYVLALITGALTMLFDTSYHAFLPGIVPQEQLVEANSKLGMSDSLAEIAGPPLGAGLVQLISAPFAALFDSLSFVFSAGAIWRIDRPETQSDSAESIGWADLLVGIRYVLHERHLRILLGCAGLQALGGGAFVALYELFLLHDLGFSPTLIGLSIGVGGIGALLGAFLAEPCARRFGIWRILGIVQLSSLPFGLLLVLASGPLMITLPLVIFSQLSDVFRAIYTINALSYQQQLVPDELRGRVISVFAMIAMAALLIGTLMAGIAAGWWGARTVILIGVLIMMVGSVWVGMAKDEAK